MIVKIVPPPPPPEQLVQITMTKEEANILRAGLHHSEKAMATTAYPNLEVFRNAFCKVLEELYSVLRQS